ncbi:MAG: MoaD/ThiS family protein [Candidatus Bilamarchaeum sp.]
MKLLLENQQKDIQFEGNITTLLRDLQVSREEVVIKINGKLAPETAKVTNKDSVEIIKVVFGG